MTMTTTARTRPPLRPRVELLEGRVQPSAGALDPSFGGDGVVTAPVGARGGRAADVAVQPDGKIVAVGWAFDGKGNQDFALTRFTAAGSPDGTFGTGGQVVTAIGRSVDAAEAVAVQADGKILVGGTANLSNSPYYPNQNFAFALARYNPNGTLDTKFGNKGKVTTEVTPTGIQEGITDLALQPDGKIVAVGASQGNILVVRYTAAGALDASFDGDGKRVLDLGGDEWSPSVAVQPDGKIVVAGGSGQDNSTGEAVLFRLNPNGALDPTFGANGVVLTDVPQPGVGPRGNYWTDVAVRDGKIVTAGTVSEVIIPPDGTGGRFVVARYAANGALDPTFGGDRDGNAAPDGYTVTPVPHGAADVSGLAVDAGGRIVLAGRGISPDAADPGSDQWDWDFAVARYTPDGRPDAAFGAGGLVVTDISGTHTELAAAVAVQADGKIVAAGLAENPATGRSEFALTRYLGDGPSARAAFPADAAALVPIVRKPRSPFSGLDELTLLGTAVG